MSTKKTWNEVLVFQSIIVLVTKHTTISDKLYKELETFAMHKLKSAHVYTKKETDEDNYGIGYNEGYVKVYNARHAVSLSDLKEMVEVFNNNQDEGDEIMCVDIVWANIEAFPTRCLNLSLIHI